MSGTEHPSVPPHTDGAAAPADEMTASAQQGQQESSKKRQSGGPFNRIFGKLRQFFNKGTAGNGTKAPRAKSGEHNESQTHAVEGHPSADTIGQAARITES